MNNLIALKAAMLVPTLLFYGCTDTSNQDAHLQIICVEKDCAELTLLENVCQATRQSIIDYESQHLINTLNVKESFVSEEFVALVDRHILCLESDLEKIGYFKSSMRKIIEGELSFAEKRKLDAQNNRRVTFRETL